MNTAFEKIKTGLEQAIAHSGGKHREIVLHNAKPIHQIFLKRVFSKLFFKP